MGTGKGFSLDKGWTQKGLSVRFLGSYPGPFVFLFFLPPLVSNKQLKESSFCPSCCN